MQELLIVNHTHNCFSQINAGMKLNQMKNPVLLDEINHCMQLIRKKEQVLSNDSFLKLLSDHKLQNSIKKASVLEDS